MRINEQHNEIDIPVEARDMTWRNTAHSVKRNIITSRLYSLVALKMKELWVSFLNFKL